MTQTQVQPKYKGIWEPVNYADDIKWFDVFFATANEGWVVGGASEVRGGIIIHTADSGDHWEVQYGDPQSSDGAVHDLRFLDATHGWATQWTGSAARLLHTADGNNWQLVGTLDEHYDDYMFTSELAGIELSGDVIKFTTDGGRSWKEAFPCAAKIQVDGLWQNVTCQWRRLQFLTPSVGYAIAKSGKANKELFLAKTADGGATWSMTAADLSATPEDAFFIDESTGYVRTGAADTGQVFKTTDGGKTWNGMAASPGERIQFADPEVGWAVLYRKISFTTDGGSRWNSREYSFPVSVRAFSLPRRDQGYVVGEHGMIYRYRIVPVDYTAKGMLPAPLLSGIDSPLDFQVQQLAQQVQKLAQDVGLSPANVQGTATSGAMQTAAGATNEFAQTASSDANAATLGTTSGLGATSNESSLALTASAGTGMAGCTASVLPGATSSVAPLSSPAPDFTAAPASASEGFVQDTSVAATTVGAVSTSVPQFVSRYRNLNLLLTGFAVATQMPATAQCLKQSFQTLKNAKDPQTVMANIASIQGQVGGLVQMTRLAFQKH